MGQSVSKAARYTDMELIPLSGDGGDRRTSCHYIKHLERGRKRGSKRS